MMRNIGIRVQLCIIILLLAGGWWAAKATVQRIATETPAMTELAGNGFSCYTYDSQGNIIQGFEREADGIWYLFVPSTQCISDTVIHYTGDVTKASYGQLDREAFAVSEAFVENGDQIELKTGEGMFYTVVVMQSNLPSVQLYLNGTTLDEIHADKDVKYGKNTFILTDVDGTYDMSVKGSVEIKGRGNSTWMYADKKGYQIKFAAEIPVMGMEKAKKWVLSANAFDDSMMRNQLVYQMAAKLDMGFVPEFEYVNLWIDGEYLGIYLLGEKPELDQSRIAYTQPDAMLFEQDEGFWDEEEYSFYCTKLQRHFTVKDKVTDDNAVITQTMQDFEVELDELAQYLYSNLSENVRLNELAAMIDVDSFVKYYLINEYVLNSESIISSFYWYKDGTADVIHLGPVWDYDSCMGNDGYTCTDAFIYHHVLFRYLLAVPEFRERTEELYEQYKEVFAAMTENVDILKEEIQSSAEMNYLRWDVLGKASMKETGVEFAATFEEAVTAVKEWLCVREENFAIMAGDVIASEVSEDCATMTIRFKTDKDYESILFAVRNSEVNPDEIEWCTGQEKDGVWSCTVDLTKLGTTGIFYIDAFENGAGSSVAIGYSYVG